MCPRFVCFFGGVQLRMKIKNSIRLSLIKAFHNLATRRHCAPYLPFALNSAPQINVSFMSRFDDPPAPRPLQMLNVVRPCTDEPRMLSAIASLVSIRTSLLEPLYTAPPYANLEGLMAAFGAVRLSPGEGGAIWHLRNISSTFDALADVFEKQTKSPSVKSLYDLRELVTGGHFVIRLGEPAERVLVAALGEKENDLEFLLDLRSKLLMAEVPKELDEEFGATVMVEGFISLLQVMFHLSYYSAILFDCSFLILFYLFLFY